MTKDTTTTHATVRLTPQTRARLHEFARQKGVSISAAHRLLLERGLVEYEREIGGAEMPRRRVYSKGVG
jgi:Zn-dependent peptidase ImmA (M78 family)